MNNNIDRASSGSNDAKHESRPVPAKARELLGDRANDNKPVWIRAPRGGGPEHYTGFSRSKLYELDASGLIRSVSIRKPGQVKGTRLFNLASILRLIDDCERDASAARNGAVAQ